MPTVIVNKMTAVHSKSNGTSICFPDVCKTPTPGGPIPIPYPNIAMSSDASDEVKKVKFEGAKLMGKGSKIKMSSGDEAGSAQGVVSNKIKGKAEFVNYSFDVKAGGKNVCRLADPMQQNMGTANGAGPAVFQPPNVAMEALAEYCEKTNEKPGDDEESNKTNWGKSGVAESHRPAFEEVAKSQGVLIFVRWSNPKCTEKQWIQRGHRPKPHAVFFAKTISGRAKLKAAAEWCDHVTEEVDKGGREEAKMLARLVKDQAFFAYGWVVKARKHRNLSRIQGVIGEDTPGTKFHHGMPLRAAPTRGGLVDSIGLTKDYSGKWVTGDYDLYDIMWAGSDCDRLDQNETSFRTVQELLNGKMKWHGIQHGPQVQWCPRKANHDVSDAEDFPPAVKGILAGVKAGTPDFSKKIDVGGRGIPVMGGEIIAVYPGGTKSLDKPEDVANALLCKGCGE